MTGNVASLWGLALVPAVVLGIHWMRSPRTAVRGNRLSMLAMAGFVLVFLADRGLPAAAGAVPWLAAGGVAGVLLALRVRMLRMPELIALFNGIGGAASAIVALVALAPALSPPGLRVRAAALLAIGIGAATFTGSGIAVLKLSRIFGPAPVVFRGQAALRTLLFLLLAATTVAGAAGDTLAQAAAWAVLLLGAGVGWVAMLRVGGADMPVSISLLNALSGVAAAVAGYALGHPVPVAVGAVVGAGGLMLTRLMCRAMNRRLGDVLGGRLSPASVEAPGREPKPGPVAEKQGGAVDPVELLRRAKRVVIVPGYGMALGQAQQAVRRLFDALERRGAQVCFAVHPVAGRMPGHMHVLLAEVDIPYDKLREMDDVNPEFPETDVAVIVGANDVVNPAATSAEGTPIHGMPVLHADRAMSVVVCNLDDRPGYAGVPNPLFTLPQTVLCLGNAADTVSRLAEALEEDAGGNRVRA